MKAQPTPNDSEATRSEIAEYLHDMAGQLSEMARTHGLTSAADALAQAQRAVEAEF